MATLPSLTFGELLRRYRLAANMTQEVLAARSGLSPQGIGALERGDRRTPREATVRLLADALALSSSEYQRFLALARRGVVAASAYPMQHDKNTLTANPLIGRTTEIAQLYTHLADDALPLMLITGEPGIGKTRLLQETANYARASGWTVLQGKCYQRNGQEPYAPFGDMLAQFLAGRLTVQQHRDLQGCTWLGRLVPEIVELMPSPRMGELALSQERRLVFSAVARLLMNVADPIGTLVILDDAQWAGEDTLHLLAALVRLRAETAWPPLRYIVAYRNTEIALESSLANLGTDLAREHLTTCLTISPLDDVTAGRLLDEIVKSDAATRQRLVQQSGGVPFFLVEWAKTLASGIYTNDVPRHKLPGSIFASLQQRWGNLSPTSQDVLGIVAIAGSYLPRRLLFLALEMLVKQPEAAIALAVDDATYARLLTENADGSYACAHDIIRETIINTMSIARRLTLHHAIAEAIEANPVHERRAAELAWHFSQADLPERAFSYALRAGKRAEASFAHDEAEQHYQMAIELAREINNMSFEAEALEHLGVFYDVIGRQQDAIAAIEQTVSLYRRLDHRDNLARATTLLARGCTRAGQTETGARHLAELLAYLTPKEPSLPIKMSLTEIIEVLASPRVDRAMETLAPWSAVVLVISLAIHLGELASPQQALIATENALRMAKMEGSAPSLAIINLHLGMRLMEVGRLREARQVLHEATHLGEHGAGWTSSYALAYGANCAMMQGEIQTAESMWAQALQRATQMADPAAMATSTAGLSDLAFLTGNWPLARHHAEAAWAIMRPQDRSRVAPWVLAKLRRMKMITGEMTLEVESVNSVLASDEELPQRQALLLVQQVLAEADLLEGRGASARARLAPFIAYIDQIDVQLAWLFPWIELVEGNLMQSLTHIQTAIAQENDEHLWTLLTETLRIRALCYIWQKQWQSATLTLEEALTFTHEIPMPYAEAKALFVLGEVQMAQGASQQARDSLLAAQAICGTLGEKLYSLKIQQRLATLS